MKRKHFLIIGIPVLLVLVLIVFKLAANKKQINEKSKPKEATAIKIPVQVATANDQMVELSILKTGNLAAYKEAKVLTTVGGIVKQLRVELGTYVRAGQVLAVIDTRSNQIDLQKAESNVAKLKSDVQTYTELLEGKATTREKLEQLKQDYNDALNQSTQIRRQIGDANVTAPIDGIISIKSLEQGVYANAGTEIATIVNLSQAKVQVQLTEDEVYKIQQHQAVKITTDVYPDIVFDGNVTFISPQADETHNYTVEVLVKNTQKSVLRSGSFVYADFSQKSTENVLTIPREALTESIKNAAVYVVDKNNKVSLRPVTTGREMTGLIEIRSGLQKGEQVVVSGQINLANGTEVTISK